MNVDPLRPAHRAAPILALAALAAWGALMAGRASAQDPAALRLFRDGERKAAGDPAAAIAGLALLVEQFPRDDLAPKALLHMAEIHRGTRDAMQTNLALDRLIEGYGRSAEAAAAFLMRGSIQLEVARSAAELETARATLRRVPLLFGPRAYVALPARAEARLLEGRVSRMLGDDEAAAAAFIAVLEDEPVGPATPLARLELARLLVARGEFQAAAEILQRALDAAAAEADGPESSGPDFKQTDAGIGDPIGLAPRASRAERDLLALIDRRLLRPMAGISLFSSARAFPVPGIRAPAGVSAHGDGRLLIVDDASPAVAVVAPDGRVLARTDVRGATGPSWDGDRPTISTRNELAQPFGGRTVRLAEPGKGDGDLKGILTVARGTLGDRYVAARGEAGLLRYATIRRAAILLGEGKREIADVTADAAGRIYALDRSRGEIWRIGIDRVPEPGPLIAGEWKRASAIAVDALGTIFVVDRANRRIDVFDDIGNRMATFGPLLAGGIELRTPVDIAVDDAGRLYIADLKLPHLVVVE